MNAFSKGVNVVSLPSSIAAPSSAAPPSATSAPSNSTASLPAGWTAVGCRKDNVAGRALNVDAFTSESMTIGTCVAHCATRGHTVAGVEYARECYCGSAFVNGGGAVLADGACNMACAGDGALMCGGRDALPVFQKGVGAAARRSHKARHFGRAHERADLF